MANKACMPRPLISHAKYMHTLTAAALSGFHTMMLGRRDTSPVATSDPSGETARQVASPECPSWKLYGFRMRIIKGTYKGASKDDGNTVYKKIRHYLKCSSNFMCLAAFSSTGAFETMAAVGRGGGVFWSLLGMRCPTAHVFECTHMGWFANGVCGDTRGAGDGCAVGKNEAPGSIVFSLNVRQNKRREEKT